MSLAMPTQRLSQEWKDCLGLSARRTPDLYEDVAEVGDTPYAGPIRAALRDLDAAAVFCVQNVPTAVFFAAESADPADVAPIHSNLWNQGLASVLVFVCGETVRIYSLANVPEGRRSTALNDDCLIQVLHKLRDALEVRSFIHSIESGRYWKEHKAAFHANQRVDGALLGNLDQSHWLLQESGLPSKASQALLMQTMFIAYLEDRGAISGDYIKAATHGRFSDFSAILEANKVTAFHDLFRRLNRDFNGDLFVKPCSFDASGPSPKLQRSHLDVLARFRVGREEMTQAGGQLRLWSYNFEFIPVELVSAVYDQFLSTRDRAPRGQFHTPMYLASSVVSQLWDDAEMLGAKNKASGTFLDPACGSGIFLVCVFKRLCEQWRLSKGVEKIRWRTLQELLSRVVGWDVDDSAVRVAAFSLYVALLEQVTPPDIRRLMGAGKLLPRLLGNSLRSQDFFGTDTNLQYDVVLGNPPWRVGDAAAAKWCAESGLPAPKKQAAWGFVWKGLRHLKEGGRMALLLPAMGFLHNHSKIALEARRRLFREIRVRRILDYADLRRQLFGTASQPAALFVLEQGQPTARYQFDYWVPKAGPGLRTARLLSISNADKKRLDQMTVENDPLEFSKRRWMNGPEDKLFRYLGSFPRLRSKVTQFKAIRTNPAEDAWVIGQGFQPASEERLADSNYQSNRSEMVASLPFLAAERLRPIALDSTALSKPRNGLVHRRGFEQGFSGPRVLVTQGVGSARLKACYTEDPFTFQHAVRAIVVPDADRTDAKLLSVLLNSKLMFWFALHGTASIGSERPKVHQDQLLDLPFPMPADTPEVQKSLGAKEKLVALWDESRKELDDPLQPNDLQSNRLRKVDALAYDYFCLADEEIVLVEDTVEFIAPAIQPAPSAFPEIWKPTTKNDRQNYARYLRARLSVWLDDSTEVNATLVAQSHDVAILRLDLCAKDDAANYHEEQGDVGRVLTEVAEAAQEELPGGFLSMPDLRVVVGTQMYLVKPNQKRFWLRSAGLDDADDIVVDLQQQLMQGGQNQVGVGRGRRGG